MTDKIIKFLEETKPDTPCVVIDLDVVEHSYKKLQYFMPKADIFYAVKANPGEAVVKKLVDLNSNFDCASIGEIELVLSQGATAEQISYGNTVKKEKDIKKAYELGIRLFCFDSEEELHKISRSAPGSKVFCRIMWTGDGADWPLSKKFGCETQMAVDLLTDAPSLGLEPYGVSFHVGSQQRKVEQWRMAISEVYNIFQMCLREDVKLQMINLGGGFPATYLTPNESIQHYADGISQYISENWGDEWPRIIIEPGRSMVGDSGIIQCEVVSVTRKSYSEFEPRWVYLDVGKFSGLAETIEEAIKYRFVTSKDKGGSSGPVIFAGPTCDSADILYEKAQYEMPLDLCAGDKILILSTGAYTTSYSSVWFNGFEPLKAFYI